MRCYWDPSRRLEVVFIEAGEYHTSGCERIISTVLGSCVAVCLKEEGSLLAGMNHFLLPAALSEDEFFSSGAGRYGMWAMEKLITELIKRGADKRRLRAKVFGGGSILRLSEKNASIPSANARFALRYLEMENIPVLATDLEGAGARSIHFFTGSGKVEVRRMSKEHDDIQNFERNYLKRLRSRGSGARVELFERRPNP